METPALVLFRRGHHIPCFPAEPKKGFNLVCSFILVWVIEKITVISFGTLSPDAKQAKKAKKKKPAKGETVRLASPAGCVRRGLCVSPVFHSPPPPPIPPLSGDLRRMTDDRILRLTALQSQSHVGCPTAAQAINLGRGGENCRGPWAPLPLLPLRRQAVHFYFITSRRQRTGECLSYQLDCTATMHYLPGRQLC